jgi:hypothetical protein
MAHALRQLSGITLALATALSCTAILKPRDDAERCSTATDCEPTGDNRYVPLCVFDEDATDIDSTKVEKICVASYKNIACTEDINVTVADLVDECGDYPGCDVAGALGCEPDINGQCMVGSVNQYGVCDDGLGATKVGTSYIIDNDLASPDILDQFCRGFFCDDRFVCFAGSCVPCDPDLPYGMGGCGEVWRRGARSTIYDESTWDEDECADASADTVVFGTCPGA